MKAYRANGKLLISGEYLVLEGALSLAIPTKKGQSLHFQPNETSFLEWKSVDENKNPWLEVKFNAKDLEIIDATDFEKAVKLQKILQKAFEMAEQSISYNGQVITQLEFPLEWGLGSSSTLISCISQWLQIDPFDLHFKVSNGSAYDIACAKNNSAITYQLLNKSPKTNLVNWKPSFSDSLFFVYLNKKQSSENEVNRYLKDSKPEINDSQIKQICAITESIIECSTLKKFNDLIDLHEEIMGKILHLPTIKNKEFPDYKGSIKSLGAWGGDFILATGDKEDRNYFINKGLRSIIEFKEYPFLNIIDKQMVSLVEINSKNTIRNFFKVNNFNKYHLYRLKFTDNYSFYFGLIASSSKDGNITIRETDNTPYTEFNYEF